MEARDKVVKAGLLGKVGMAEVYCYYHMRSNRQPAGDEAAGVLRLRDVDRPGPAAALRRPPTRTEGRPAAAPPVVAGVHEYGNGIVGDMCIHMLDMVRWMFGLGWPKRVSSDRRHPGAEGEQVEHLRHADRDVRLPRVPGRAGTTAPTAPRPTPNTRGARPSTATRGRSS